MKKLSLKNLNFNSIEKLQREELKTLLGGGGYGGSGGSSYACGDRFRCTKPADCYDSTCNTCILDGESGYCESR